jgi:hypothetical protein
MPHSNTVIRFLVLALLIAVCPSTWAQSPPHQHATPNVIDGSTHPELIPDPLAYRLYLTALATDQTASEASQEGQNAHLMKTGLGESDKQTLISILSDFKAKYDALVAEYNDSAKAALARNQTTDVRGLLTKLNGLVQSTRDTISVRLSSQGAAQLHSFVMSEKKNMKVLPED